jgi:hypothetical protein
MMKMNMGLIMRAKPPLGPERPLVRWHSERNDQRVWRRSSEIAADRQLLLDLVVNRLSLGLLARR